MLREGTSVEGVTEAADQKLQDFYQKLGMYTDQYWRLIIGQTTQWKGGIANFKADDSALSFYLEFIEVLKDKQQSYKVTSQVFGDHTQI